MSADETVHYKARDGYPICGDRYGHSTPVVGLVNCLSCMRTFGFQEASFGLMFAQPTPTPPEKD